MAILQTLIEKWVALYVRLSRDDENEGTATALPTKSYYVKGGVTT